MDGRGGEEPDVCYFHRDLKKGSYGGDVSCLQTHLKKECTPGIRIISWHPRAEVSPRAELKHPPEAEGFMAEEPSGYFGSATEEALQKWQVANKVVPAKGVMGFSSRVTYSRKYSIPTTEDLRTMEKVAEEDGRAELIEFTCELVGSGTAGDQQQQSLTRKCKENASYIDRMHLCGEACQMAVSEACDKAFPTSQNTDYKKCLRLIPRNCRDACKSILSQGGDD